MVATDKITPTTLIDANNAANSIAEDVAVGTQVGITALATDPGDTITYALSTNPSNLFKIDASTGIVTTAAALNYETGASKTITVKATDSTGLSIAQDFAINITNVNEAPYNLVDLNTGTTISSTAAINSNAGINAKASDVDAGDKLTYSLTDDANGQFVINPTTGAVTVAKALDGLAHDVTVKVTDAGGLSTSQTFHIGINNNNAAPSNLIDSNASLNYVKENAAVGTTVGITANAIDTNVDDKVTYSLADNAGGKFAINSTTGVVTVAGPLDGTSHNIIVQATDNHGASTNVTYAIQSGNIIHVSTAAELANALQIATGGETILLKAGVNFGNSFKIYNPDHQYNSTVTIKSEDVNDRATLEGVYIRGGSNIVIDSVRIAPPTGNGLYIYDSNNITVQNSELDGGLKTGVTGQANNFGTDIRGTNNITLDGNDIHNFYVGTVIGQGATSGITVKNNFYHDNLGDNSEYASNISNVLIENNTYHAPDPTNPFKIHQDNIQFWVEKDATQDTSHVIIRGNFIVDLTQTHSQSIFLRGDYGQADPVTGVVSNIYRIKDVTVENNVLAVAVNHGISLSGVDDGLIQNNTVIYVGPNPPASGQYIPQIFVRENTTDIVVKNNITPALNLPPSLAAMLANNIVYQVGNDSLTNLLVNPNVDVSSLTKEDLATLHVTTTQAADGTYMGALSLTADAHGPTAVITQTNAFSDGHYNYTFDATHSLAASGANLTGANYQWQFADGSTAQGATVSKTFAHGGEQAVVLKVTDAQGHSDTVIKEMAIHDIVAVKMNFDGNILDTSANPTAYTGAKEPVYIDTPYGGKALQLSETSDVLVFSTKADVDLANQTESTIAFSLSAAKADNPTGMHLLDVKGAWDVGLTGDGRFSLYIAGAWIYFPQDPKVNLTDGAWHDFAITSAHNTLSFFVDGNKFHDVTLTQAQSDAFVTATSYGLVVGGTPNGNELKGAIDNLYIGTTALTAQQIADMHVANTTIVADSHTPTPPETPPVAENHAPISLQDSDTTGNLIGQDAAIGTAVGVTAFAVDADANDKITYSLSSNPDNLFAIDANTGIVTLAAKPTGNAESYDIKVDATDTGGLSVKTVFTIGVVAVEEGMNLIGTESDDTMVGGNHNDVLSGSMGQDELTGGGGNDALQGNQGADREYGGDGNDTILGGKGADQLNGNAGNDTLNGNLGDDNVRGGKGDDVVFGGQGNDSVYGDMGNDTLSGDLGRDYLMGGNGNDVFVFTRGGSTTNNFDTIGDFTSGEDKIDLTSFGYTNVQLVSSSSSLVTSDPQTLVLHVQQQPDGSTLLTNPNLDFAIKLEGSHEVTTTDFLL